MSDVSNTVALLSWIPRVGNGSTHSQRGIHCASGIQVIDYASGVGSEWAIPCPSVRIYDDAGTVGSIQVRLVDVWHTYPGDMAIYLLHEGVCVTLMENCCNVANVNPTLHRDLTFDDSGIALPASGMWSASTLYHPTALGTSPLGVALHNPEENDCFPWTAPGGTALSAFSGTNKAGIWALYAADDTQGDHGWIGYDATDPNNLVYEPPGWEIIFL